MKNLYLLSVAKNDFIEIYSKILNTNTFNKIIQSGDGNFELNRFICNKIICVRG